MSKKSGPTGRHGANAGAEIVEPRVGARPRRSAFHCAPGPDGGDSLSPWPLLDRRAPQGRVTGKVYRIPSALASIQVARETGIETVAGHACAAGARRSTRV